MSLPSPCPEDKSFGASDGNAIWRWDGPAEIPSPSAHLRAVVVGFLTSEGQMRSAYNWKLSTGSGEKKQGRGCVLSVSQHSQTFVCLKLRQGRCFFFLTFYFVLEYSRLHFLVAQMVKNMPAVQETWVRSLSWKDPPEKRMALQCSCLENSMDRRAWQATVHGIAKSWTWLSD